MNGWIVREAIKVMSDSGASDKNSVLSLCIAMRLSEVLFQEKMDVERR